MKRRDVLSAAVGLLSLQSPAFAVEGENLQGPDLEISPTSLRLGGPGDTAISTISNNGTLPATAQIRIKAWRQVDGRDVYEDTDAVVASPPFATVSPGQQQVVRVANLSASAAATELAFRVLVNQVPSPGMLTGAGVKVLIAFNLPLFISGEDALPPQLEASFVAGPRSTVLRLVNQGDVHARVSNLAYRNVASGEQVAFSGLACYVLARSARDLVMPMSALPPPGGTLMLQTQFSRTPVPVMLTSGG